MYNTKQLELIALIKTADAPAPLCVTAEQKAAAEAELLARGIVDSEGQFVRNGDAELDAVFNHFM